MSIKQTMEIECPKCGINKEVVVWKSINVQLNPEAKKELLEAKTNLFHCGICSFEQIVPVVLLYHDMEKEFCVQFFPFNSLDDKRFLENFTDDGKSDLRRTGEEDPPDYFRNTHIVFSMDELVRYVIFRDRLAERR